MDTGELLTRWSARIALILYILTLSLRLRANHRRPWLAAARRAWFAGLLAFLLHVAFAFHFSHSWSHRDAYDSTARQTRDLVGWDWGGGLWANYLFAAVWLVDGLWWTRGLDRYEARPRRVEWLVQGFLGFIAFNATVVFPTGAVRWTGVAATLWLLGLHIAGRSRPVRDPTSLP